MSSISTGPLADAIEREKAACDLSTTYLVEAAAGTGKTTLLVSRILTIVETTLCRLSSVVAITFTEKAAGELKTKLKSELERRATETGEAAERCRLALRDLEVMPVGTIHSFCADLIRQLPVEAGIDPDFAMLDEMTSQTVRNEWWGRWLSEQFAADKPEVAVLLRLGMRVSSPGRDASLHSIFDALYGRRDELESLRPDSADPQYLAECIEALHQAVRDIAEILLQCCDPSDLCARELFSILNWATSLELWSLETWVSRLPDAPRLKRNVGRREAWKSREALDRARELCDAFTRGVHAADCAFMSQRAATLIEWLKKGVRRCSADLLDQGLLDFDDLLIRARGMLRDSRAAREWFKERYAYILVDEFQDTDLLQAEVVFFLSEKPNRFAVDWQKVELDAGKLFLVGDPKQSIYRFRRADLDLYGRVREKIALEGKVLVIRANFRSEPGLISEANALFSQWMTGHPDRYEPGYANMEPHRLSRFSGPRVHVLPPPTALLDEGKNSSETSIAEAACVGEYIRHLVSSRSNLASDDDVPPVALRDIAILYPTTSHLASLEAALRSRDIPFEVTGGRDLAKRVEIQALRVVLAAIDNPHDGPSVGGALRSPFFACNDEELLRHRLHGGHFDYTSTTSTEAHLERSFALLRRLHDYRCHRPPSETLALLFEETTGLQVFALKPRGENRVANLLKILDMARSLETTGSYSFHRLVRWLDRLEELRLGEDESVTEKDTDAVRLMTFHKAKGLEFPVVILYHLRHDFTKIRSSVVVDRAHKSIEFRIPGGETTGYAAATNDDSDRQRHESWRQLYVAMTRARDLLVLPLGWISPVARSSPRWLHDVLASRYPTASVSAPSTSKGGFSVIDTSPFDFSVSIQESLVIEPDRIEEPVVDSVREHRQSWAKRRMTAVNSLDHTDTFVRPSEYASASMHARGAGQREVETDAAQFGLFVHRLLERVALPNAENLDELRSEMAEEFSIPERDQATGMELVRSALASDLFTTRLAQARRYFRELAFTACVEDRVIEGAIDLAFREDNGWIIVDFKTDAVSSSECITRAENYRHQVCSYAQAVTAVTGEEVAEAILYFLRPDVQVAFKPRDWS